MASDLKIIISARNLAEKDLANIKRSLQGIETAAAGVGTKADAAGKHMHAGMGKGASGALVLQSAMSGAGQSALAMQVGMFGLAAGGAFVGATMTKAAFDTGMSWESAFAGVRKTVDATEQEFAQLSSGIRNMAKEIPATREEIARVAEAAGQLGIQKDAILEFTRTMVDLGVATNMSSDQAATSLARLANITQMPQTEFGRLGSTVVELGNKFASTEQEIVDFGLRIAGAGYQIGLSEAQILGWGTALSSVGIEAEAGGTAISRIFVDISAAVNGSTKELETIARVAGVSAKEFADRFKTDANGAVTLFVEGLGRMKRDGEDVFAVLESLGMSEIRQRDALLRLSSAQDLVRKATETGTKAWSANKALVEEANKRYETTESKLTILKSKWTDLAVEGFGKARPFIDGTIDALSGLADIISTKSIVAIANTHAPLETMGRDLRYARDGAIDFSVELANLGRAWDNWQVQVQATKRQIYGPSVRDQQESAGASALPWQSSTARRGRLAEDLLDLRAIADAADEAAAHEAALASQATIARDEINVLAAAVANEIDQVGLNWDARERGAQSAAAATKTAASAGKAAASAFESAGNEARDLARDIDDELGASLIRVTEIGQESGDRWIEQWGKVDESIKAVQRSAEEALQAMADQEILNESIAIRKRNLDERIDGEKRVFDLQMDDTEYHHREEKAKAAALREYQRALGKASNDDDRRAAEERYREALEDIRLAHLEFDAETQWRLQQEDKRRAKEREWSDLKATLDRELHDEELNRRRAGIEREKEERIAAINDEWTEWQKAEKDKTTKAIAEEKLRAAGKLIAWRDDFINKLANESAPGVGAFAAMVQEKLGAALASLGGGGAGGGEGNGAGWYQDPRHMPGGDVFEAWWAGLTPGEQEEAHQEHPEWAVMDTAGAVPGPWGAVVPVLARGGEQFSGFPPRDAIDYDRMAAAVARALQAAPPRVAIDDVYTGLRRLSNRSGGLDL